MRVRRDKTPRQEEITKIFILGETSITAVCCRKSSDFILFLAIVKTNCVSSRMQWMCAFKYCFKALRTTSIHRLIFIYEFLFSLKVFFRYPVIDLLGFMDRSESEKSKYPGPEAFIRVCAFKICGGARD